MSATQDDVQGVSWPHRSNQGVSGSHAIFNIHGGNNLIAPTASQAEQKLVEKPADEIKKDKE